jgi:hypothetical protein
MVPPRLAPAQPVNVAVGKRVIGPTLMPVVPYSIAVPEFSVWGGSG